MSIRASRVKAAAIRAVGAACRLAGIPSTIAGPVQGVQPSARGFWQTHRDLGVEYRQAHEASTTHQAMPRGRGADGAELFADQALYRHCGTFCLKIPRGRIIGDHGIIVGHDDRLIEDVSYMVPPPVGHKWWVRHRFMLPRCRHLDGTVVSIAAAHGFNYFHWITDHLPRLHIAREAFGPDVLAGATIAVPDGPRFIDESLLELGVPAESILHMSPTSHIQADTLVAPSMVGPSGLFPPWLCPFLRSQFLSGSRPGGGRRWYVSRGRAAGRHVLNEDEVVRALEERGFEAVSLDGLPFRRQVEMFAEADVVVAPHGAALTNLLWCRPGTQVVELFAPDHVRGCFWTMAQRLDLRYCFLIGDAVAAADARDGGSGSGDMRVPIDDLKAVLRELIGDDARSANESDDRPRFTAR